MPFPENEAQASFNQIDDNAGNIGDEMRTIISIVGSLSNTVVYYDHWEDGYEADITSPTQSTSEVWGDGNAGNGIPPGFTNDVIVGGTVVNLEGTIDVTRNEIQVEYDGRDKFSVTKPVAVSRAMYAVDPGEVLAGSAPVFDSSQFGLVYRAPVGEGTGAGANTNQCFEYSSLFIMAAYDFTRVDIDEDNDGTIDTTVYLDEGEHYHVDGGVTAGATVTASKPVQVHLLTGDIGSNYEMRWFELWPEYQWGDEYYTAVNGLTAGSGYGGSILFIFNPNTNDINVTAATGVSTSILTITAGTTYDSFAMPQGSGAHLYSTNGEVFIPVQLFDTYDAMQAYDWGLGLPPKRTLTTMSILGWGPGNGVTDSGANGNPVWAMAVDSTTLYVDYDGDPTTGSLTDPYGNLYDFTTNVAGFESIQIYDQSDTNQTGMRVYTVDGTYIVTAWGEDPTTAGTGNPYLDMGNTILPFPTILAQKYASIVIDLNTNGLADPGDSIEFYIEVVNVGFATANNVVLEDDGVTNKATYDVNSTEINGSPMGDDFVPPKQTPFPFDEGGANIGTIQIGETSIVTYVTTIIDPFPTNELSCIHNEAMVADTNGQWNTLGSICVMIPGLVLTKTNDPAGLLDPGDPLSYTITLVNTGNVTFTGIHLEDLLPVGVTYVDDSAQVVYPSLGSTNTVLDQFDTVAYTNNDGSHDWADAWDENNDDDSESGGTITVSGNQLQFLQLGGNASVERSVDLSSALSATLTYDWEVDGLEEDITVYVSTNGSAPFVPLATYSGGADSGSGSHDISSYMSAGTTIRIGNPSGTAWNFNNDYAFFDDIQVEYTLGAGIVTNDGGVPPEIFSQYQLEGGETITVTLDVTVDDPAGATQLVNVARARADQHRAWIYDEVTNQVDVTQGVTITKANSVDGLVTAGTPITYTITIENTGDVVQTSVELDDLLPLGVTYVDGSAEVWRPYEHSNNIADQFHFKFYTNNTGNVDWLNDWQEIGDDDDPESGDVQIDLDGDVTPGRVYALSIDGPDNGIWRMADLGGYTSAVLSFEYRRDGLDGADDIVAVYVSDDGGTTWSAALDSFAGGATDPAYIETSYDITAYIASNTAIRFLSPGTLEDGDYVWFDGVQISYTGDNATNKCADPPDLFSEYTIPPRTSLVVTLDVTVDDPPTATQMINTARMRSDQQPDWLNAYVTNSVDATVGYTVDKTSSVQGHYWGLWETNLYTITIANTGQLSITGIDVYDLLPSGSVFVAASTEIITPATVTNVTTNVVQSGAVSNNALDQFDAIAFNGDDGTYSWEADWQEISEANGADVDAVRVENVWGSDYQLRVYNSARGASRELDLTAAGATSAVLSFEYRIVGYDGGESSYLSISSNGTDWIQLETWTANLGSTTYTNYDISAFISADTEIVFSNAAVNGGGEGPQLDNVQIHFWSPAYVTNITTNVVGDGSVTNNGSDPPGLGSGYSLATGETLTVTFETTLDLPAMMDAITNTVVVSTDQLPDQDASVTDLVARATIGDFVWWDLNTNGVQDAGETQGISGVTVNLYDDETNLVATTTTAADGSYLFEGYPTNAYFLEFVKPADYWFVPQDVGGNDNVDSDADTNTGYTAIFDVGIGQVATNWDAGLYIPPGSIGDFVWWDLNTNGLQDVGEGGLTNVTVNLYDGDSNFVATTSTDSSGAYRFEGLLPGDYFLSFELIPGYTYTPANEGGDDSVDSDANVLSGQTTIFTLSAGGTVGTWDAGLIIAVGGLSITKTSDSGGSCYDTGDIITYTIVVENTGTVTLAGIQISDPVPTGTTYVAGSAGVVGPGLSSNTVRDEFSSSSYTANDGTASWNAGWNENEPYGNDDDPAEGYIQITGGRLNFDYTWEEYIERDADLSGSTYATLSFDWETVSLEAGEEISVLVGTNVGGTLTTLASFTGTQSGSTNFDITSYVSADTVVRIDNTGANWSDANDDAYFDNIEIAFGSFGIATNAASAPPVLVSGKTLETGQTLTVTFQVSNNTPTTVSQIWNKATTVSGTTPPVSATVTDCVNVTDLGVVKSPNKSGMYGTNEFVWFTITVTNNGPTDATSVRLTEYWPTNVIFFSASPEQGTYEHASRIWSLGDLNVGSAASMVITGRVNAPVYIDITNTIEITYLDQFDTNPANDIDNAVIATLVTVTRFEAFESDGHAIVEWETSSEVGTAGFFLYRFDEESGAYVRINEEILPGLLASPRGGIYRLDDTGAEPGTTYSYVLREVEVSGHENPYGPFIVQVPSPLPHHLQVRRQRRGEKPGRAELARKDAVTEGYTKEAHNQTAKERDRRLLRTKDKIRDDKPDAPVSGNILRLTITNAGLYRVTSAELAGWFDLPEETVRDLVMGGDLLFKHLGEEVTYVSMADGSALYFYGEEYSDIYSDINVYWLGTGKNGPVTTENGAPNQPAAANLTFAETLHFEVDQWPSVALFKDDPDADIWLWEYAIGGNPTMATRKFEVDLPGLVQGEQDVEVVAHLRGATTVSRPDEHHAILTVNDVIVGEGQWGGLTAEDVTGIVDSYVLTEGVNTIAVTAVRGPEIQQTFVAIDSFDISYQRSYTAMNDQLICEGDGNNIVTVSGLNEENVLVWNISDPHSPNVLTGVLVENMGDDYRATFKAGPNAGYLVATLGSAMAVERVEAVSPTKLMSKRTRADYVVITPPELKDASEDLAAYRASRGWTPLVVEVDDIYDAFNYGLPSPDAIQAFLAHAYAQWALPPSCVVLIGKGTYDHKNILQENDNLIPIKMVATEYGLFAADNLLGDVTGKDGVPEMAIGRIPVLNASELYEYVEKVQLYEASGGDWRHRVILVADDPDIGGNFKAGSERLGPLIDDAYEISRTYIEEFPTLNEARIQLLSELNVGSFVLNYLGHGSLDRFASEGLLLKSDISGLSNGTKLPVVLGLTCIVGRYDIPGSDSLAEELLLHPSGGAVAVWSPTGMSLNHAAEVLDEEVFTSIFVHEEMYLGDAVLRALDGYSSQNIQGFMIGIYNLLGDPALELK